MDEDKLSEAYHKALDLEKNGEFDAAAAIYKQVLKMDSADHGGVSIRMASMGKAVIPDRAPKAYVTTLFNQHADVFDTILVDNLGYKVPQILVKLLADNNLHSFDNVLDLGCGTGLIGVELSHHSHNIIGVDLAENMIEIAYDRDVYQALYIADIEDYLDNNDEGPWNLICAGDVFPYLGNIDNLVRGISKNLVANGYVIFSTETLDDKLHKRQNFIVGAYQRFAHHLEYIKTTLSIHQLETIATQNIIVRYEQGQPVHGHLVLATKKVHIQY